ncbi:hypothetical protein [Gordonia sp. NPDC003376]
MTDEQPLGPAGMRALQRVREELKAERRAHRLARQQLEQKKAQLQKARDQVAWLSRVVVRASNRMVDVTERIEQEEGKNNG